MPAKSCELCGAGFSQGRGRPSRRCPSCREGGGRYGGEHRKLAAATKEAAWGTPCARCRRPMLPGTEIHLDHADGGGPADYAGWSHASCNESAGAKLGNAMRGQVNGQRAPGGPAAARAVPVVIPPAYEPGSIRHQATCTCGGAVTWAPDAWWTSRCW